MAWSCSIIHCKCRAGVMYMSLMDRSQNCRASLEKVLVWSFAITPFLKICTFHTSAWDRVQIGARGGKCWSSVSPIRELMLLPVIARQASQLCAFYNFERTNRSLGVPVIVSQNRKLWYLLKHNFVPKNHKMLPLRLFLVVGDVQLCCKFVAILWQNRGTIFIRWEHESA